MKNQVVVHLYSSGIDSKTSKRIIEAVKNDQPVIVYNHLNNTEVLLNDLLDVSKLSDGYDVPKIIDAENKKGESDTYEKL